MRLKGTPTAGGIELPFGADLYTAYVVWARSGRCGNLLKSAQSVFGDKAGSAYSRLGGGSAGAAEKYFSGALSARAVVERHTIFKLMERMLPSRISSLLMRQIIEGQSVTFHRWLNCSRIFSEDGYRWCPCCRDEDLLSIGFGVWRSVHQVQDVWLCPKHLEPLVSRCADCDSLLAPPRKLRLPGEVCPSCGSSSFLRPQVVASPEYQAVLAALWEPPDDDQEHKVPTESILFTMTEREPLRVRDVLESLESSSYLRVWFPKVQEWKNPLGDGRGVSQEYVASNGLIFHSFWRGSIVKKLALAGAIKNIGGSGYRYGLLHSGEGDLSFPCREIEIARVELGCPDLFWFCYFKGARLRTIVRKYLNTTDRLKFICNEMLADDRYSSMWGDAAKVKEWIEEDEKVRLSGGVVSKARYSSFEQRRASYRGRVMDALSRAGPLARRACYKGFTEIFGWLRRNDLEWLESVLPEKISTRKK